ncbi:MAG: hypothetical protein ACREBR_01710, partial [bacterium]
MVQPKSFQDGETVHADKLMQFLRTVVIDRPSRRGGNIGRPIGIGSVKQYIAAIVDLYNKQRGRNMNSHPNPRNSDISQLLQALNREKHHHRRANYVDRGIGTLLDGVNSTEQWGKVYDGFMEEGTGVALRNRLAVCLCNNLALRGELCRRLELPDLFCIDLKNEGPQGECKALVAILGQGKTNQFGKIEFGAAMRNREVRLCLFGALAMWLFWRFEIEGEPYPDFSESRNWYDTKVICSKHKE